MSRRFGIGLSVALAAGVIFSGAAVLASGEDAKAKEPPKPAAEKAQTGTLSQPAAAPADAKSQPAKPAPAAAKAPAECVPKTDAKFNTLEDLFGATASPVLTTPPAVAARPAETPVVWVETKPAPKPAPAPASAKQKPAKD